MYAQPSFNTIQADRGGGFDGSSSMASPRPGSAADPLGVSGVGMAYARNKEIFGEGEPATCLDRVSKGVVRTCRILADGRRQIVGFALPGDVLGLALMDRYGVAAEAGDFVIRKHHLRRRFGERGAERGLICNAADRTFEARLVQRAPDQRRVRVRVFEEEDVNGRLHRAGKKLMSPRAPADDSAAASKRRASPPPRRSCRTRPVSRCSCLLRGGRPPQDRAPGTTR